MAEKAAQRTTTIASHPTIFEVNAQEELSSMGYPALKKIVDFIVNTNPERLKWLILYFDEVFLALNAICQYHYLKKYGGTFSENFFDLTRVSRLNESKPTDNQLYINLCLVVGVPYLRRKFETYIDQLQTKYELQFKDIIFITMNKIFYTLWEAIRLIYYIKYVNGSSKSHSPLLDLAGMILTHKKKESLNDEPSSQLNIKEYIKNYLYYGLSHSLELGAFFIQFLDKWQSENLQSKCLAYPIPDPPKKNDVYKSLINSNKCPICNEEKKMPTALTVSGFVFCYKCLHKSLMVNPRCPVTKLPATIQDMVRIYSDV